MSLPSTHDLAYRWRARLMWQMFRPDSVLGSAELAMRRMFGVLIVAQIVIRLGPLRQLVSEGTPLQMIAALALCALDITILLCLFVLYDNSLMALVVSLSAVIVFLVLISQPNDLAAATIALARGSLMTVALFWVASTVDRLIRLVVGAALFATEVLLELHNTPDNLFDQAIVVSNSIVTLALLITAAVIIRPVRLGALSADLQQHRVLSTELEAAAAQVRARHLRETERLLHDEVLHALRVVKGHPGDSALPDRERALAATAVTLLVEHAEPRAFGTHLTEALQTLPAEFGIDVQLQLQDITAPDLVVRAITGAVSEALRNVERHAGVTEATVIAGLDDAGAIGVEVIDHGRGFVAGSQPGSALGLRRSVIERMTESGGHATVSSAPDQGTSVTLIWSPSAPTRRGLQMNLGQLVSDVPLPFCLATAPLGLLMAWFTPYPVLALACAAVLCGVGVAATRQLRTHAELSRPWAWLLGLLAMVGIMPVAVFVLTPAGQPNEGYYWLMYGVNATAMLLIFARPYLEAGLVAALLVLGNLGLLSLRFGLPATIEHYSTVLSTNVITAVAAWLFRLAIDRVRDRSDHATQELVRSELQRAEAEANTGTVHAGLLRIRTRVTDLLAAAADGAAVTPDIRRRAGALEAEVRDELALPDLRGGIREALYRLRMGGWTVDLHTSPEGAQECADALALVLDQLAGLPGRGQNLVLTARGGTAAAVVAKPSAEVRRAMGRLPKVLRVIEDPDFIRISTRRA